MSPPLKWASQLGHELLDAERVKAQTRKRGRLLRKHEYERLDSYKQYSSSGLRSLNLLDGALRYLQTDHGVVLGQMQEDFINATRIAMLPKMFGDDLVSHLRYLHKRYKFKALNNTLGITFPRRSGKTVGAAIMAACTLVSQKRGNCIMFNLTGTQARMFLSTAKKYLDMFQEHETFGWKLKQHDSRQFIEIENKAYGSLVTLKSFASGSKGNGNIDYTTQCERDCSTRRLSLLLTLGHIPLCVVVVIVILLACGTSRLRGKVMFTGA